MKIQKILSGVLAASMAFSLTACGGGSGGSSGGGSSSGAEVPTFDQVKVGEDYTDLTAEIQVFTNRTDLVNTDFQDYVAEFNKLFGRVFPAVRRFGDAWSDL